MSAYALSEQQQMLADSVKAYLGRRPAAASATDALGAVGTQRWSEMAALGWLALPVPEAWGGLSGSMSDICALTEEMGKAAVNEPYIASAVLAGMLLAEVAPPQIQQDWLPALAQGSKRLALAAWEPDARFDWTQIKTCAFPEGAQWRLEGSKVTVLGGPQADALLLSARLSGESDLALFLLPVGGPGQTLQPQTLLDGQTCAELTLKDARGAVLLSCGEGPRVLARLEAALDRASLAHCADTVGAMTQVFMLTREYLGTRSQFGKPIAANQVVQHRLVDLFVEIEEARALMRKTARLHDAEGSDAARVWAHHVAATKAFVAQVARHVWEEAVQLHGAIGMTQEYAVGAYVKRLALAVSLYGDATFHLERLAAASLKAPASSSHAG